MKMFNRAVALLLLVCMLFTVLSCGATSGNQSDTGADTGTVETPPTAAEMFSEKAEKLNSAPNRKATVSEKYEKKTGDAEYTEEYEYTLEYIGIGTEDFAASISTKTVLEKSVYRSTQTYRGGAATYEVDGDEVYYSAEMTAEDYMSYHIPAVILAPENYTNVTYDSDKGEFSFTEASSHESWIAPEYAKLTLAKGTAKLTSDGDISEMYYEAEYVQGAVTVSAEITVKLEECTLTADEIKAPKSTQKIEIDDINTAVALKYAYTMLDAGLSTNGQSNAYIVSNAVGWDYKSKETFASYGEGESAMAIVKTDINVSSNNGGSSEYTSEMMYKDGAATYSENGGDPQPSGVSYKELKDYIDNTQKSYLYNLQDMSSVTTGHLPDYLVIDYNAPVSYGEKMEDAINDTLFGDKDYLDSHSSAYSTTKLTAYLCIDRDTGFVVASGLEYAGVHTIDGVEYELTYTVNVKNELADPSAYTTITGDPTPDKEPEQKATPLFYKVTSPEGNTMYLLGTIHVGDERTAYLPDEIIEALESSDSLSLEIVIDELEDMIMEDKNLLLAYGIGHFLPAGKSYEQMFSAETYELIRHAEKVLGDTVYSESYYPSVVTSMLQYALFDASNVLYEDKGVDNRILKIAREKGIEVIGIEELYGRVQIDSKYPELAHTLMLESAVTSYRAELIDESVEMYELWCRGDEAEFRAYLAEEDEHEKEEMTEEELAAYEEYDRILRTDRDAQMVEKAKEYLTSGKTVFVAVGAAHVLGEGAMVDSLRAAGYTVELVEYK